MADYENPEDKFYQEMLRNTKIWRNLPELDVGPKGLPGRLDPVHIPTLDEIKAVCERYSPKVPEFKTSGLAMDIVELLDERKRRELNRLLGRKEETDDD